MLPTPDPRLWLQEEMVALGGNVHAATRHGVTPLWHAAAGGHMAAVSVLLAAGASPAVQVGVHV
jgi:ankyrin repeat protein